MSETVSTPTIKSAASFASLLEAFTGPAKKTNGTWDDTALLDDVATISYEQALRSNRRVLQADAVPAYESQSPTAIKASQTVPDTPDKKRKSSSITIRLTEAEVTQLHDRAAAAQLTVSGYLRSCIFEAESLRAQVKEALSEMKAASAPDPHSSEKKTVPAVQKHFRLFPRWIRRPMAENGKLKTED